MSLKADYYLLTEDRSKGKSRFLLWIGLRNFELEREERGERR